MVRLCTKCKIKTAWNRGLCYCCYKEENARILFEPIPGFNNKSNKHWKYNKNSKLDRSIEIKPADGDNSLKEYLDRQRSLKDV